MYRIGLLFTLQTPTLDHFLLQSRTASLLKESDRFLKRSGPSLSTSVGAEIATTALSGKFDTAAAGYRCDPDRTGAV